MTTPPDPPPQGRGPPAEAWAGQQEGWPRWNRPGHEGLPESGFPCARAGGQTHRRTPLPGGQGGGWGGHLCRQGRCIAQQTPRELDRAPGAPGGWEAGSGEWPAGRPGHGRSPGLGEGAERSQNPSEDDSHCPRKTSVTSERRLPFSSRWDSKNQGSCSNAAARWVRATQEGHLFQRHRGNRGCPGRDPAAGRVPSSEDWSPRQGAHAGEPQTFVLRPALHTPAAPRFPGRETPPQNWLGDPSCPAQGQHGGEGPLRRQAGGGTVGAEATRSAFTHLHALGPGQEGRLDGYEGEFGFPDD